MTGAEIATVRTMADRAEGLRQLCYAVASGLSDDPATSGLGEAVEAMGWMAGEIGNHLGCLADPAKN
ncbi:hypothetical protein COA17_07320 [Sphingomonas ginsenosidimutans]|uniref:Uncharacterized protein n=1 Tax=Sphingomonas ginsenosidimutans TaxID=862134 RepID=A0A2A4HZ63_9SPHN|nr:hypothetical protein [Sphingomonas ginsenosidimutans]PCG09660.1 hypothetical protein COA17_07320 [Sphingomonas ginsenosidimutans]